MITTEREHHLQQIADGDALRSSLFWECICPAALPAVGPRIHCSLVEHSCPGCGATADDSTNAHARDVLTRFPQLEPDLVVSAGARGSIARRMWDATEITQITKAIEVK